MSVGTRLQGQDCTVRIVLKGQVVAEFDVQTSTFTPLVDLMETEFVGESAAAFDERFRGWEFSLEGEATGSGTHGVFTLQKAIIERAQRKAYGVVVNITFFAVFPNGDLKGVVLQDCKFGSQSVNITGGEHVKFSFGGNASKHAYL